MNAPAPTVVHNTRHTSPASWLLVFSASSVQILIQESPTVLAAGRENYNLKLYDVLANRNPYNVYKRNL